MYEYKAKVEKIIDGDTVDFTVDLGFKVNTSIRCRLARIDAPSIRTKEGKATKEYLVTNIPVGTDCVIKTQKTDIYGRYLAEINKGVVNINDALVSGGLAQLYDSTNKLG